MARCARKAYYQCVTKKQASKLQDSYRNIPPFNTNLIYVFYHNLSIQIYIIAMTEKQITTDLKNMITDQPSTSLRGAAFSQQNHTNNTIPSTNQHNSNQSYSRNM